MSGKPGRYTPRTLIAMAAMFLLCCVQAQAGVLTLDKSLSRYAVDGQLEYVEDPSAKLGIQEIASQPETAWKSLTTSTPSFGFNSSAYWFRVTLQTEEPLRWLLDIDYPLLDEIALYSFAGGKPLQTVVTGDVLPFDHRPLKHVSFVIPLDLPAATPVAVYLRVKSMGAVQVPMSLWQEAAYYEHYETVTAVQGMYFGIVLIMIFYNLLLSITVREPAYVHYVLFVTAFGLFMAEQSGWAYRYLWPEAVRFQQYSTVIFLSLSVIFACRFIHHFLDLPRNAPAIARLLLGVVLVVAAVLVLLPLLGYHLSVQLDLAMTFVTSLTALYAGVQLWRNGKQVARYFTIAWSSFLLAALLATLEKFGYFPSTVWADVFLPLGVVLIVSLLSLALAARINIERQQRIQAQQQLILQNERNQAELERKIAERTAELAKANAELQLLATTDSLTGIDNRRHFLERANHEIDVSIRYRRPIALVMLDIDFFQAVNDTYGHEVGDRVLRHLVAVCRKAFRESDLMGRLGGEEFGILLREANAEAAQAAAERLRREIEDSVVEHEDRRIKITVSQGICAVGSSQQRLALEQMLKVADDALYQAKNSGRNRVVVIER